MAMTLRQFYERYHNGDFDTKDANTQVEAGWADWFCNNKELPKRLKEIGEVIDGVTSDFVLDNYHAVFRNCSSAGGSLYDVIQFEPVGISAINDAEKYEQMAFSVMIDGGNKEHKYEVFTSRNGYQSEVSSNNVNDIYDFINSYGINYEKMQAEFADIQNFSDAVSSIPVVNDHDESLDK